MLHQIRSSRAQSGYVLLGTKWKTFFVFVQHMNVGEEMRDVGSFLSARYELIKLRSLGNQLEENKTLIA